MWGTSRCSSGISSLASSVSEAFLCVVGCRWVLGVWAPTTDGQKLLMWVWQPSLIKVTSCLKLKENWGGLREGLEPADKAEQLPGRRHLPPRDLQCEAGEASPHRFFPGCWLGGFMLQFLKTDHHHHPLHQFLLSLKGSGPMLCLDRRTSWSFLSSWRRSTKWRSTRPPCSTCRWSVSTSTSDSSWTACTWSPCTTVSQPCGPQPAPQRCRSQHPCCPPSSVPSSISIFFRH